MRLPYLCLVERFEMIMKKIEKSILSFIVLCITVLMISVQINAQDIPLNLIYECSSDILIYEEPDYYSSVLEERKKGEFVCVITPGTTWSKVFCNGEAGYVLTQYLRYIDKTEISEDEAFAEESYTKEYEEVLQDAYEAAKHNGNDKKAIVLGIAIIVVFVFAGVDIWIIKHRKKKKTKKVRNKNA